jgi:hypothetical protein
MVPSWPSPGLLSQATQLVDDASSGITLEREDQVNGAGFCHLNLLKRTDQPPVLRGLM